MVQRQCFATGTSSNFGGEGTVRFSRYRPAAVLATLSRGKHRFTGDTPQPRAVRECSSAVTCLSRISPR